MQVTNVETPWEMVSIDLVGPLPRSKTGNTWLIVMQDRFTKWIELRPLKTAISQAITMGVKDQICLRHGCPATIVSDNERQFTAKELKTFLQEMHIAHRLTSPYTPQCNPVERANRVIKTMIAQNIKKSQKTWDVHLAELQFAYNTANNSTTGFSIGITSPREVH